MAALDLRSDSGPSRSISIESAAVEPILESSVAASVVDLTTSSATTRSDSSSLDTQDSSSKPTHCTQTPTNVTMPPQGEGTADAKPAAAAPPKGLSALLGHGKDDEECDVPACRTMVDVLKRATGVAKQQQKKQGAAAAAASAAVDEDGAEVAVGSAAWRKQHCPLGKEALGDATWGFVSGPIHPCACDSVQINRAHRSIRAQFTLNTKHSCTPPPPTTRRRPRRRSRAWPAP